MNVVSKKIALAALAGVMSLGLVGGGALAAFTPTPNDPSPQEDRGDKLKSILDGLVTKGVITQAQADSIAAAVKTAAGDHQNGNDDKRGGTVAKGVFADLMAESAKYLGMDAATLKTKLQGTSLGAIANATTGKSRDGLVIALTDAANAAIAKAQADNKITADQANTARTNAPEEIAKFIDHKFEVRPTAVTRAPKMPNVHAFIGDVFGATRTYLGLTQKDLMTGLKDGKSLAEIANGTPTKNRDGLVTAITTGANAKIDKAVTDGKITAAQATDFKAKLGTAVGELVDHKGKAHLKK